MRRSYLAAGLALALVACQDAPTGSSRTTLTLSSAQQAQDRYIVRFRDTEQDASGQTDTTTPFSNVVGVSRATTGRGARPTRVTIAARMRPARQCMNTSPEGNAGGF